MHAIASAVVVLSCLSASSPEAAAPGGVGGSYPALRFDAFAGSPAADATGASGGIYVNDPGRGARGAIAGDADGAVTFDGVSQYMRVPVRTTDIGAFGTMLQRFSVELWYRGAADNRRRCLLGSINDGPNTAVQVERDQASGRFNLLLRCDGGPQHLVRVFMSPQRSAVMADGSFHHVVWVVTSAAEGTGAVYLDGEADPGVSVTGTATGRFAKLQHDLAVGASNVRGAVGQYLEATLDEVALYADALDAVRVAAHHAAGVEGREGRYARAVAADAPVAHWRLGESSPNDLHLLLDDRIVERVENAVLRVGAVAKHDANPLFGQEHPWEVMYNNLYPNVLYDHEEGLYKIWHTMFVVDSAYAETTPAQRTPGSYMKRVRVRRDGLGYAVSRDGIVWEKPMLNVQPWEGRPSNLLSEHVHGAGILKDLLERDPARRYKMFFRGGTMSVRFSPDGVHWGAYIDCPEIRAAGDTHNNALWVDELKRYVGFTRLWQDQRRVVGRTESPDFVHWSAAVEVLRGRHLFDVYAMPVFRYAGVYLGLPAIFDEVSDRVHTELAWSADTVTWHRVDAGTPLIANAPRKGAYDWGTVYASPPILESDAIRIYYGGCDGGHFDWRDGFLCLATLRPDGFAAYEPAERGRPAVVVTQPVVLGTRLRVTADAGEGSITVVILDAAGAVLRTSLPLRGDVTDATVPWPPEAADLRALAGRRVRLRFEIDGAKLYSFLL